jgi:hypothetical protein
MFLKKILITQFIVFLNLASVYGGIDIGLGLCNNHWQNDWLLTPAPEISYTSRWFSFGLDGTLGSYAPSPDQNGFILQTRISVIPMFRLPLGSFSVSVGYGFSSLYRREEIKKSKNFYDIRSSIHISIKKIPIMPVPSDLASRSVPVLQPLSKKTT